MAALELDGGVAFDAAAFDRFLAEQPDLGTKWAPRFVRIVDAIPVTATGKVDRKPLRAERWTTSDPVWWRPGRGEPYRRLTDDDVADLRAGVRGRRPGRDARMRFAITHPLITHPYHPDLVTGAGVATVARAAEAAGFHGYGFTDHPAPTDRWLQAGGHDALDPFVAPGLRGGGHRHAAPDPEHRGAPVPEPVRGGEGGGHARHALGRSLHARRRRRLPQGRVRRARASTTPSATSSWTRRLGVIRAIWTGDDVTVEGRHFSARGITAHPRPVTQPHPPIWIGGNSGQARQRVADHGDGWCPFPAPAIVATTARTASLDTHRAAGRGDRRPPPPARRRGPRPRHRRHRVLQPGRRRPVQRRLRRRRPPRGPGRARRASASPGCRSASPATPSSTPSRSPSATASR